MTHGATIYVLYGDPGEYEGWHALSFHSTRERAEAAQARRAKERTNPGSRFEAPWWTELEIRPEVVD